jgi:hypothetical protein
MEVAQDEVRRASRLGRERGKQGEDGAGSQREEAFVGVKLRIH